MSLNMNVYRFNIQYCGDVMNLLGKQLNF